MKRGDSVLHIRKAFAEARAEGRLSPDVPSSHLGYFELQAVETLQAQEKLVTLPQLPTKV